MNNALSLKESLVANPLGFKSEKLTSERFIVTIESGSSCTLFDDMIDYALDITFILKAGSTLFYSFRSLNVQEGGAAALMRTLTILLQEPHAQATIDCSAQVFNDSVVKFKTFQHHQARDTKSSLSIRGVVHDSAKIISENLIRIEKGAEKVVASEENKNLSLSDNARVISIPKLEVEAHDVSCKHGAAISRLSSENLFYVQSRGLDEKSAQKLLIDAFLLQ